MQTTVPAVTARRGGTRTAIGPLRAVATAAARLCDWAAAEEGRRRTARVLRALDRTAWQVVHHVAVPSGGHVDHVVIGPAGICVLRSEAWRGVVTVDQKGATITPAGDPDAAWTARGRHRSLPPAAAAVARGLAAATGSSMPAPCAVVVVWAPFPDRVAVSGGVTYVAGEQLAAWLGARPRRLDHDRLADVAAGALTAAPPRPRGIRTREPV
jgi:hypothetical protein